MGLRFPIYLDNHATTKIDPRVVEAMMPYFTDHYGNAASVHEFGFRARAAVELARKQVARLINADEKEIFFTSGATESINLALKGVAGASGSKGRRVIMASTEHKAVLDTCRALERAGFVVTVLPVDEHGMVSPDELRETIDDRTILVSIMAANNEIGTIAPIHEIAEVCRERGVWFHSDATQAVGKIALDVGDSPVDLISFSAHKMHGPKGIGALYVRSTEPKIRLIPQIDGGGHERGLRSGTLDVPGICGFGKAAELAAAQMNRDSVTMSSLRDRLVNGITEQIPEVRVNGHPVKRLPNNASVTFAGVKADTLLMDMRDIAISTGSACSSEVPEPSHVLHAIGLSRDEVLSSVRFGLSRFTTQEEIDYTVSRVVDAVRNSRKRTAHPTPVS